jgi:non-canonical (house-cleaning) NTP pyrophosphatase
MQHDTIVLLVSKQLFVEPNPVGSSHTFHLATERGPVHEHCVSQSFHLTIEADPVHEALDISVIYHTVDVAQ